MTVQAESDVSTAPGISIEALASLARAAAGAVERPSPGSALVEVAGELDDDLAVVVIRRS